MGTRLSDFTFTFFSGNMTRLNLDKITDCFHTVHGVLEAGILKWFAIPFSSGPHFVRPLHHDPSVNLQMFKLDLEKPGEPEIKLLTSIGDHQKSKRVPEKHLFLLY